MPGGRSVKSGCCGCVLCLMRLCALHRKAIVLWDLDHPLEGPPISRCAVSIPDRDTGRDHAHKGGSVEAAEDFG